MEHRLYRSETDRMIAGVCGGLGEYFDVDPLWVRLAFVLLAFANGLGVVAYVALWIFMPRKAKAGVTTKEALKENVEELKGKARELAEEVKSTIKGEEVEEEEEGRPARHRRPYFLGALLILIGLVFLVNNFGFFWWFHWGTLWPLILIFIGIALLLRRKAG